MMYSATALLVLALSVTQAAFVCPNPPAPANFDLKSIEGVYYDYLSTAEYDAQTYCVKATYAVADGALNITVDGFHGGPRGVGKEQSWSLLLTNSGNGNPSQFTVSAASMPVFVGTTINFYWANDNAVSWSSCYPTGDATYEYEIHALYKVGTTFTGDMIDSLQSTYMKENLNPDNTSWKISPHPTGLCH